MRVVDGVDGDVRSGAGREKRGLDPVGGGWCDEGGEGGGRNKGSLLRALFPDPGGVCPALGHESLREGGI